MQIMSEDRKAGTSYYLPSSNCALSWLLFLQLPVLRVHISIKNHSEVPCVQKSSFLILLKTGTDFSSYAVQNAEVQWVSSICGKTTAQKALFKHIENIHFPGAFSYNCSLCDQTFSNKNSYYKHKNKYHRWNDNNNILTTCIIVKPTCLKSRWFVLKMDK